MVLELGVLHIYFQKQVARIVKSLQDLPEPSPVNRSLKRQHVGIRAAVVVDVKGQESVSKLFEKGKTRSLNILMTRIVAEPDVVAIELSQEVYQYPIVLSSLAVLQSQFHPAVGRVRRQCTHASTPLVDHSIPNLALRYAVRLNQVNDHDPAIELCSGIHSGLALTNGLQAL